MRWNRVRSGLSTVAALAVAGAVLGACSTDRESFMEQVGDALLEFTVETGGAGNAPTGSNTIDDFEIAIIDETRADDAFNRITRAGTRAGYSATGTRFGAGWNFPGWGRNATTDPRAPTIISTTATIVPQGGTNTGFVIGDPNEVGAAGFHNPFLDGSITGLQPTTTYVVAFYRYGVVVNGALDQVEMATTGMITEPDSLVPLGGTPKGDPTVPIVSFPTIISAQDDANPFVLGQFTTNASGAGAFDVVIDDITATGTPVLYTTTSGNPPDAAFDSALVARNDMVATSLPRYNYMVVLEGTATTAAEAAALPQVLRLQMGVDFDPATGQVRANAFAPFPTQALTKAQLLASPGASGRASDLTFTFRNLAELTGAVYQVWLFNAETNALVSPPGNWRVTAADTLGVQQPVDSAESVRTFNSRNDFRHTFITNDSIAGEAIGQYTHIFLSIEATESGAPSAAQPLWAQYTDMHGAAADPFEWSFNTPRATTFGSFALGTEEPWTIRGSGRGAFSGDAGVPAEMRIRFRDLDRPPVGYYYEGWLVPEAGAAFVAGDMTASAAEGYASLRDADVSEASASVSPTRIVDAVHRIEAALVPVPFYDLVEYHLVLSPKARSAAKPPTIALLGEIPDAIRAQDPED